MKNTGLERGGVKNQECKEVSTLHPNAGEELGPLRGLADGERRERHHPVRVDPEDVLAPRQLWGNMRERVSQE